MYAIVAQQTNPHTTYEYTVHQYLNMSFYSVSMRIRFSYIYKFRQLVLFKSTVPRRNIYTNSKTDFIENYCNS